MRSTKEESVCVWSSYSGFPPLPVAKWSVAHASPVPPFVAAGSSSFHAAAATPIWELRKARFVFNPFVRRRVGVLSPGTLVTLRRVHHDRPYALPTWGGQGDGLEIIYRESIRQNSLRARHFKKQPTKSINKQQRGIAHINECSPSACHRPSVCSRFRRMALSVLFRSAPWAVTRTYTLRTNSFYYSILLEAILSIACSQSCICLLFPKLLTDHKAVVDIIKEIISSKRNDR